MAALITDRRLARRMIARRRRLGLDRFDEVWDGVYVLAPAADNQHQGLGNELAAVLTVAVQWAGQGLCLAGVNISDRQQEWTKNFRCPDIAVFLRDTAAVNCGEFWYGGPDFAVEVVSRGDRSRKKLPFYAKVGTRELLLIDRRPWRLSLYRLTDGRLRLVEQSTWSEPRTVASEVVPLRFRLTGDSARPAIQVEHHDGRQQWTVQALLPPAQ